MHNERTTPTSHLAEVAGLFLKLGLTSFGGPAAHTALMREEVVVRRKWIEDEEFLDLMGATNLIPGPNSTELAIHLGHRRAGLPGLIVGGVLFILPAMLIVMGLAWVYVEFGEIVVRGIPLETLVLYGIQPVIVGIILQAITGLAGKAVKDSWTGIVGTAAVILFYALPLIAPRLGNAALMIMLGGGLLVMLVRNLRRAAPAGAAALAIPLIGVSIPASVATPFSLWLLFLTFLKIGSVLYGSGLTLLAFVEDEFVRNLGWLTTDQMIDAIAIGQFTPGPVFTTATFIGYLLGGFPGALLATLGIFLPSFIFVGISIPLLPKLRGSKWVAGFLDGVNVAALGLMAAVLIQLAAEAFTHPLNGGADFVAMCLGAAAAIGLFRFRLNTTWLILGGGLIGAAALLLL